ncbi:MAG: Asp-tRNA(Asn)/Glu-tRNA(Gln) amidotransferase subunit GatC [Phycisphaeraceae bacterium]
MPESTHKLSEEQVRHVSKLARLRLSDTEVHDLAQQLSAVLRHVEKLNELDLTNVEPMAHAMDLANVLRPDEPGPTLTVEQVLANAPDRSPPFFKVPKVLVEGGGA